ncbi:MAG: PilN domain-containing protein [Bdellovibrionaceae bacterium]|nr:PilN domain-containing protein [Pseudobdellovibrionaceae bacterium]
MIRVNLLRNLGLAASGTSMTGGSGDIISVDVRRQAAVRLVVILLFPLLLLIWEKLKINSLEAQKAQTQQRVDAVEGEKSSFGSAGPRVEKANKLKQKIQREIAVIRDLAKNRLREVKALDQLQSVLPAGVWLKKVTMESGKINMVGLALTSASVTELLTALNSNVFFSQVEPKGTKSQPHETLGNVTEFQIQFRVGRQED